MFTQGQAGLDYPSKRIHALGCDDPCYRLIYPVGYEFARLGSTDTVSGFAFYNRTFTAVLYCTSNCEVHGVRGITPSLPYLARRSTFVLRL